MSEFHSPTLSRLQLLKDDAFVFFEEAGAEVAKRKAEVSDSVADRPDADDLLRFFQERQGGLIERLIPIGQAIATACKNSESQDESFLR